MHLTSLRLGGFKSFADDTTIELTPGITAIVGPNGSGKSNIVDALTWALGTRSPRQIRSTSMSDVIFAGSAKRRSMGRARVSITIDNSDGFLPVEFSEVSIGRALYQSGESSYTINDTEVRQIDVADLLSDTGLGRESHTIVGQGKIDAILTAEAAGRRVFIEEAAGILKHRRRKERAQRKIVQLEEHLVRLDDTARELKRQARPLKRQAKAARMKRVLDARLKDLQVEEALRAFELASNDDKAFGDRLVALKESVEKQRVLVDELVSKVAREEELLVEVVREDEESREVLGSLKTLLERSKGLVARIEERRNGLSLAVENQIIGQDPADLRQQALSHGDRLTEITGELERVGADLLTATEDRDKKLATLTSLEQGLAKRQQERSRAKEAHIRWEGQVSSLRSEVLASAQRVAENEERYQLAIRSRDEIISNKPVVEAVLPEQMEDLVAQSAEIKKQKELVEERLATSRNAEREAGRYLATCEAKENNAIALSKQVPDGLKGLLSQDFPSVLGTLLSEIQIDEEFLPALTTVLGQRVNAVIVSDPSEALEWLKGDGSLAWLVSTKSQVSGEVEPPFLGAITLLSKVAVDESLKGVLGGLLGSVFLADDAVQMALEYPSFAFVDKSGMLAGNHGFGRFYELEATQILSAKNLLVEAGQEREKAQLAYDKAVEDVASLMEEQRVVTEKVQALQGQISEAVAKQKTFDTAMSAHAKEVKRAETAIVLAEQNLEKSKASSVQTQEKLQQLLAEEPSLVEGEDPERLSEVAKARSERQLAEEKLVETRFLQNNLVEEQSRLSKERDSLIKEAVRIEKEISLRDTARKKRQAEIAKCVSLAQVANEVWIQTNNSVELAKREAAVKQERHQEVQGSLREARKVLQEEQKVLEAETNNLHEVQLKAQEARQNTKVIADKLGQFKIDNPLDLLAQRRNNEPVDRGDDIDPDDVSTDITFPSVGTLSASDREIADWIKDTKAALERLGPVNPLAAREYVELEQRRTFLDGQITDLKTAKNDLEKLVDKVQDHIGKVFMDAFSDVEENFQRFFDILFPGGKGRLVLTEPDSALTTGIEIHASPPGKKIRHLSLLSGGERTLTALALLFAIFVARPSPFYVLDEVEAALDDANLDRFIRLLSQFRDKGQWIVVTHQRRTMEASDVLHGVSMNSDGVSVVLTQHLRDVFHST